MKIETKYSIDENVWFLNKETMKAQQESIEKLFFRTSRSYGGNPRTNEITYEFNSSKFGSFKESELFKTKEDLLNSL